MRSPFAFYAECYAGVIFDTERARFASERAPLQNGRSQAVRLPKKFRFNTDEVIVQQLGDAVILVPKESMWQTFMDGLNSFTDDIFEDGRDQGVQEEREHL